MKKALSIVLSLLMVISSIACLFTLTAVAEQTNLFTNGDFTDVDFTANTATNWVRTSAAYTQSFIEGTEENLPEGEDFNILQFATNPSVTSGEDFLYNLNPVKLEKNTDYKISFWIKNNGVTGLRFALYEPAYYINYKDSYSFNAKPVEGQNIYSYSYAGTDSNGNIITRVARTDINHVINDVTNNENLRDGPSSMASYNSTLFAANHQNEWIKVEHTFSTGDDDYHVANIRYGFIVRGNSNNAEGSFIQIGGLEMIGTKRDVTVAPTPEANDYDLGTVEPRDGATVVDGKVTFTATPFGTNKFLGWYKNNKLISTNTVLSYNYDPADTAEYKAMFEAYGTGVSSGFEDYGVNDKLARGVATGEKVNNTDVYEIDNSLSNGEWTVDSQSGLSWQNVYVTNKVARSGSKSVGLISRNSFSGRNFVGLNKNTNYTVTFYTYADVTYTGTTDDKKGIERLFVVPKDTNIAWSLADLPADQTQAGCISSTDSRVLYSSGSIYGTGKWEKSQFTFNTGDNTEVTLWFAVIGGADGVFLDDLSLVENIPDNDEEEGDPTIDFEDITKWGKCGNGSTQIEGYDGYISSANESYIQVSQNTDTAYIKEGTSSVRLETKGRWFHYKLEGLKPNTKYALAFSYATDQMNSSTGTILRRYGIFNYEASGAKLNGVTNSPSWNPSGYLIYLDTIYYCLMDDDGTGTPKYTTYSDRRITDDKAANGTLEVANTWYNSILYFDSGSVSDTLALTIYTNCSKTYLDDFKFIELKDDTTTRDYFAPEVTGKTATGSYDTEKATTTLYNSITEADYTEYLKTLLANSFAEYATNAYGNNKFATYVKGNTTVNVTYNPYNSTMLVAEQVTDTLAQNEETNTYTNKGLQPLIIQLDHDNSTGGGIGMSYIIRLADGSFIIVDGGHTNYFNNANLLYDLLRQYTPEGEIQIAAWLLTHCHSDHISGFTSFVERYGEQVNIEQLIYNFATYEQYVAGANDALAGYAGFDFFDVCVKLMPDTKISTCHSGYKYHIRNAIIDVMFTLEDNFPKVLGSTLSDANNTSTTFKISFTDENVDQTLLITGDSANAQCSEMLKKYAGTELDSTFVQVIHHGTAYGSYELYSKMNPEVVLWPSSSNRLMNMLHEAQNRYFIEADSVKEIVNSDYGTRVFALPYTAPEGLTGMDKFTLPADMDEMNTVNSYVGVSIRQADEKVGVAQALRFKFQIPEHIIRANTEDGFWVAEYGMMVGSSADGLDYYAGNAAYTTLESGAKVYKGIAYHKASGTNVVYDYVNYQELNDGVSRSTQYTCALKNIGVIGKATDYARYDTTYYVRSYITFTNANGDTKVYYGDTQSASVFAVMQAILESTDTDAQTVADKAYVKNFLDGVVTGFEADAAAIKEAWVSDSTRASLYTPAN